MAATAVHEGKIREAVQALKYENSRRIAVSLGERLQIQLTRQSWDIDLIVPVPLHPKRLAERGYNQAELLSEQLAYRTDIAMSPHALERVRYSQSQVTMNAEQRLMNVRDAFRASTATISEKNILVIDDVLTTGATLSGCAEALIAAGATLVYGLTVTAARV
jgi:ComF family protein